MMDERGKMEAEKIDFSCLPEGVVANILSLTTPPDVCRSSAVSQNFKAVAKSDVVWDRFLPSDWLDFISHPDLDFDTSSSSKKDIFFAISDHPLLIDDSKKSFELDRWSGKKCLMLGVRDLSIIRSRPDAPHYCTWESHHNSRFPEVIALLNVWSLEIRGKMSSSMLSPATTYAAYFVFKMKNRYYGFNVDPIDAIVGIVGGERSKRSVCLDPNWDVPQHMLGLQQPGMRSDGWFEIMLGEFQNDGGDDEVEILLMEDKCRHSKSGIIVHGIEIRPKTRGLKL